jgi:hypothetical protein
VPGRVGASSNSRIDDKKPRFPAIHRCFLGILAGGGGGLRTGRYLTYDHPPHNDLSVPMLNLFGDPRTTFGDLGSGALGRLT